MANTHRKDGTLTVYGFACGYVQTNRANHTEPGAVYMYREHNTYHVRIFGTDVWESFNTWECSALEDARKRYAELCEYPDGYNGHRTWADWNVCLWFTNDEPIYNYIRSLFADLVRQGAAKTTTVKLPAEYTRARRINRVVEALYNSNPRRRTPDGARCTRDRIRLAVEQIVEDF